MFEALRQQFTEQFWETDATKVSPIEMEEYLASFRDLYGFRDPQWWVTIKGHQVPKAIKAHWLFKEYSTRVKLVGGHVVLPWTPQWSTLSFATTSATPWYYK
ncbi:MAG: hypothetical protein E4G98_07315 [Promethearchaeota archaeon]|nr:MAG: hypothetical protein E4G98_07315 [Candidatus Lokiarchaeota archaeon]